MAKYDPLCGHLRRQRHAEFELTFVEIERILGAIRTRRIRYQYSVIGEQA